jgi:hypothetical protein
MSAWKRTERKIASIIGGERVPVTGRQRGDVPDIRHDWLSVECKHRRSVPQWLQEALQQAQAAVRGDQLPIAVIHPHGARHSDDLVVMRLGDFRDHFGPVPAVAPADEEKE